MKTGAVAANPDGDAVATDFVGELVDCDECVAASAAAEGTNAGVDAFMGIAVWDLGVVGVDVLSGGLIGTARDIAAGSWR